MELSRCQLRALAQMMTMFLLAVLCLVRTAEIYGFYSLPEWALAVSAVSVDCNPLQCQGCDLMALGGADKGQGGPMRGALGAGGVLVRELLQGVHL